MDRNWDFENGLVGWRKTGNAFNIQPTFGDNVRTERVRPVSLGGDYWNGPFPVGHHGNYWIGTFERRPAPDAPIDTQGDGPTGTLTSPGFRIEKPFISFLIGGGNDINRLRVELQVKPPKESERQSIPSLGTDGKFVIVMAATGRNSEVMRREVWDVRAFKGKEARIRILDNSSDPWGHINVDDFRFLEEDPTPRLVHVQDDHGDSYRDRTAPVWGFADTHAHPLSHLGFGGKLLWGKPDGPMDQALRHCDPGHGPGGVGWGGAVGNLFMAFFEGGTGHLVGGYPEFDGWPRFTSKVHQQMHVDWIRRAYEGGLRLMVALAVNAELLANEFGGEPPFDDVVSAEAQVQAIRELVVRHSDFMEIADSPTETRRIVGSNKLAIVLGVEVDSPGNFRKSWETTEEDVSRYLAHLHDDLGVRHLFPIHLANNAFGGLALYRDEWNLNNRYSRGDYVSVHGTDTVQFRLGEDEGMAVGWYRLNPVAAVERGLIGAASGSLAWGLIGAAVGLFSGGGWYDPPEYSSMFPGKGHANALGLTYQGEFLIREMMGRGMMIDVDHMSAKALDDVITLSERVHSPTGERGYPLSSGHTGFIDLHWRRGETADVHKLSHEGNKTSEQLRRLANLGGIISPIVVQGDRRDFEGPHGVVPTERARVLNDCPGSSKTWANAYLYALATSESTAIGLGTDFDGLAEAPGPRFGVNACSGIAEDAPRIPLLRDMVFAQLNGVRYSEPVTDYRAYRWEGYLEGKVYDWEDRDIWEAIAIFQSGTDPATADQPPWRSPWQRGKVVNLAKGLGYENEDQLEGRGNPFAGATYPQQRGAFLVSHGLVPADDDDEDTRRMYDRIKRIWDRWRAMEGANPPLTRSKAGRRDFDINIDGVAHYGMLPDFLQDVTNVGLSVDALTPLFRSAESYIQMWEKSLRQRSYPPTPPSQLRVSVAPSQIPFERVVEVMVRVEDANSHTSVPGTVTIEGVAVGSTNVPFSYTFRQRSVVVGVDLETHTKEVELVSPTGTVIPSGADYLEAAIPFNFEEAPPPPPPPTILPWSSREEGNFLTEDGDHIDFTIERDTIGQEVVAFTLALGPGVTWKKVLNLPDGEGNSWDLVAEGQRASASNTLWAPQVLNGQVLTFKKAKFLGGLVDVFILGGLDGLTPGSQVKFTWVGD